MGPPALLGELRGVRLGVRVDFGARAGLGTVIGRLRPSKEFLREREMLARRLDFSALGSFYRAESLSPQRWRLDNVLSRGDEQGAKIESHPAGSAATQAG